MLSMAKGTARTRVPGRLWESVEALGEKSGRRRARQSGHVARPPPSAASVPCPLLPPPLGTLAGTGARGARGADLGHGKEG